MRGKYDIEEYDDGDQIKFQHEDSLTISSIESLSKTLKNDFLMLKIMGINPMLIYHNKFLISISSRRMYRNNIGTGLLEQSESQHKGIVNSSLKKELFELKDLQYDFLRLNDEVSNIESKYSLLLDEKERAQNEHKISININKKAIGDLRTQIDNLKIQVDKISIQIEDTVRENSTQKRMCENREQEINILANVNREIQKSNQLQQEQNKNLAMHVKQLKEERNKNENECERLNKLLDENLATLKQLEKEARQLESNNSKLEKVLLQAEKDHQQLLEELKNREQIVQVTNKHIEQLEEEKGQLMEKITKLDKQCKKSKSEYQELCEVVETTTSKNKDLGNKLKNLETSIRNSENQLCQSSLKCQNLKKQHMELAGENQQLNCEIDKCLQSILEYERINKDLQREIENYIECDEEARKMLNRKQSMRGLLEQVAHKLHKTEGQIAHLR